jgi:hypothetical protein
VSPNSIFKVASHYKHVTLALLLLPCFDNRWQAGRLFCCTYIFESFIPFDPPPPPDISTHMVCVGSAIGSGFMGLDVHLEVKK